MSQLWVDKYKIFSGFNNSGFLDTLKSKSNIQNNKRKIEEETE